MLPLLALAALSAGLFIAVRWRNGRGLLALTLVTFAAMLAAMMAPAPDAPARVGSTPQEIAAAALFGGFLGLLIGSAVRALLAAGRRVEARRRAARAGRG